MSARPGDLSVIMLLSFTVTHSTLGNLLARPTNLALLTDFASVKYYYTSGALHVKMDRVSIEIAQDQGCNYPQKSGRH